MKWGFISQKTAFFIVTAVKTSNLTYLYRVQWGGDAVAYFVQGI
jgi:hypothetical protein